MLFLTPFDAEVAEIFLNVTNLHRTRWVVSSMNPPYHKRVFLLMSRKMSTLFKICLD